MAVNQADILENLEIICSDINKEEFIYDFLHAYDLPKSTITLLKKNDGKRNIGSGNDIALKNKFYFKAIVEGENLEQVFEALKQESIITAQDIRFAIVTDFETMLAYDFKAKELLDTAIDELPNQYGFFLPLAGYEKAVMHSEHPADIRASEKMGQLFDLIKAQNDLSNPEDVHALNVFLTRLLFCFYAEDTGIFGDSQVILAIKNYTNADGSDLDVFFNDLFTVLNLAPNDSKRLAMPAHFQAFPYVNGGLFSVDEPIPEFHKKSRKILIDCGTLNWADINPDIFGSMFQAVIDVEQRGNLGQHYTSVPNIMKVLQPLFLDGMYEDLKKSRGNAKKLQTLLLRLENVRILDPACGSGNFLIIAYKELRRFEMEVIDALNEVAAQEVMYYSGISISNFYGIEIDDFASEIAILSLWLAEHQMNKLFEEKFGYADAALPLKESGNIVCANSLRVDWETVCPKVNGRGEEYEVYICGNPPFLGTTFRSANQQDDMKYVFKEIKTLGYLDYVGAWFWKGAQYVKESKAEIALVSTNSICQGQQVATLWQPILSKDVSISFAYQSFSWSNSAKNKAAVHVIIVGLSSNSHKRNKVLYSIDSNKLVKSVVSNISPYLVAGGNTIASSATVSLCQKNKMISGNKPTDGGNLILSRSERDTMTTYNPEVEKWINRYVGAEEFLNNKERFCLWLVGADQEELASIEPIKEIMLRVRDIRIKAGHSAALKGALRPNEFLQIAQPKSGSYILVPYTTSERRDYIPIGFMDSSVIASNLVNIIPNGTLYDFGLLTSEMHNDWMRLVGARLGSSYRYSATIVYNTFPWPDATKAQETQIELLAEEILMVRQDYPDMALAQLYDPDKMPQPLLAAHKALDKAVELLYRKEPFRNASERLEHLLGRYEKLIEKEVKAS